MTADATHHQSGPSFGLFGVPVRIDPSFFIIVLLFGAQRLGTAVGIQGVLSWFLAVFVSLLVHEFGHAVAFRRFGLKPAITLYAMGGLTSARGRMSWGRSLVASLAGPLAGLAFGGLIWLAVDTGVWPRASLFEFVLSEDLLYVNILWGIVNLLPIHPLDGGQSFEAVLHLLKVRRAPHKVSMTSIVVAGAGAAYGLYVNRLFLVLIAGWLAWTNWQRLQALRGAGGPGLGGPPTGPPRAA